MLPDIYIKKLKLEPIRIDPIVHQDALSSLVFKLSLKDGSFLILKLLHDEKRFKRESYFLNLLKNYIKIPTLLESIEPQGNLKGALLMEFLPGEIATESLTKKSAFEMGFLLAKLHSFPCDYYGDIAENTALSPALESGLFVLRGYFEEAFNECRDHLREPLFNKIKKYVKESINGIKKLSGPCICHRDFKPGNVIVFKDEIMGLIDWEIARFSFAEEDFATMEYLVWKENSETKASFFKGYESIRPLPNLELLSLMRIRKALGAMGFSIVRKYQSEFHRSIFEKNLIFLENFFK